MEQLVGVREAAVDIGVAHSSLSRYLTKYPQLRRGKQGRKVLVDVVELKRHRDENYSISGEGIGEAPPSGQLPLETTTPTAQPTPAKEESQGPGPALKHRELDAKTRSAESAALKAEIELARTQEETVARVEVEEAVMDAAAVLQSRLLGRNRELADRLAGMTDAREIAAFLDREDRRMLTAWSDRMAQLADADPADLVDSDGSTDTDDVAAIPNEGPNESPDDTPSGNTDPGAPAPQ